MGSMASAAANDVKIGLGLKDDPERGRPQYRGGDGLTDYQRRTKASVARMNAPSAADKEDDRPRQAALPMTVSAPNYNIAPVAAAPTVPDPDAIGETEQALLDAQKKAGHPQYRPALEVCCLTRIAHANAAASWVD